MTLTHLLEGGAAPVVQTVSVPAASRRTFNINEVPGLATAALSTVITSTVPVVAERAMYLNCHAAPGGRHGWPRRDGAEHDVVAGGRRDRLLPHVSAAGESQRG